MANSFMYKDKQLKIGDTITVAYKIKEGDKTRIQKFQGIIIKVRGSSENKMFTVRKVTRSSIGVERVIPLDSPYIDSIELDKKSNYSKAKAYFIRGLSSEELRDRLYRSK